MSENPDTARRAATNARQIEAVRIVLQRAKTPLMAKEIAKRAGLDVIPTTNALIRLRGLRLAREAGKVKTMILWAKEQPPEPRRAPENTPHVPSNQPNGSTQYWAKHMAAMNAPARLELHK
jgi:hypothetical protein